MISPIHLRGIFHMWIWGLRTPISKAGGRSCSFVGSASSLDVWALASPAVQAPKQKSKVKTQDPWEKLMVHGEFLENVQKKYVVDYEKSKRTMFKKCVDLHLPLALLDNNMSQHGVLPQPCLNLLWDFAPHQAEFLPMISEHPAWCRKIIGAGSIISRFLIMSFTCCLVFVHICVLRAFTYKNTS